MLCGIDWCAEVFRQLSDQTRFQWYRHDGETVAPNTPIGQIKGPADVLLTGERTALNFLQLLSGIATRTEQFVQAAGGRALIYDTRKTLPGLRSAQKYAVRCAGGHNHRFGLYDGWMIKDNHIAVAGGLAQALEQVSRMRPRPRQLIVEVDNLIQLRIALRHQVPHILLDNFPPERLKKAVALTDGRALLEASGGINLTKVKRIAASGVDRISVGHLTKDISAIDFSMQINRY